MFDSEEWEELLAIALRSIVASPEPGSLPGFGAKTPLCQEKKGRQPDVALKSPFPGSELPLP